MRVVERTSIAITLGQRRNYDLHDRMREVVGIRALRLVVPNNDRTVILVRLRCHDRRYDGGQEIVSLLDFGIVARQALISTRKSRVHIVELVWRNPVVLRDA